MMKLQRFIAALSAVALLLTACGGQSKESVDQGQTAAESYGVAVEVQRVASENIATDNKVSGRVLAEDEATIMVGVAAKCVAVYKDAGDPVMQGDFLCKLDLASTISQYNASQISYESAIQSYNDQKAILDQQVALAEKGVETAEQQIEVQRQQIAAAEANIPATERQIAAQEGNLPVQEQQIAAAEANIPVTEQQIAVLVQQKEAAEEQLAAAQGNIPVLERQIELLEPQIALAKKNVSDTEALFQAGAASQMELDNAKIQADQAEFGRDQLKAQLANTEAQLSASRVQISNLDAQIESARLGVRNARTQIEAQKAGLEQARAQIASSKVALEQARAQIAAQKVGVEQARAQITSSKAGLEQARAQIEALRLALSGYETQRENAKLSVEQAKSARSSTLAQLEAGIENARSGVQQLTSVLEDVDENGNVVAPISGTLVTFNAVENSYISNAMPVAVIQGENEMKLTASVSEVLVPKLNIGDAADVYVSALDRSMTARIRSVERAANAQTRLYTVTLTLDQSGADLLAGMFADVTFHTDRVENAIVIPSEAILTNGATQYVYIAVGETAKYVEITTGLTGTGITEVLTGLDGGEYLITVGQTYLSDGADIRIVSGL